MNRRKFLTVPILVAPTLLIASAPKKLGFASNLKLKHKLPSLYNSMKHVYACTWTFTNSLGKNTMHGISSTSCYQSDKHFDSLVTSYTELLALQIKQDAGARPL